MKNNVISIDKRRRYTPTYLWVPYRADREVPLFFDHHANPIVAFNLFAQYEADLFFIGRDINKQSEQAYKSMIVSIAASLGSLSNYLSKKRLNWEDFNDDDFIEYRNNELQNILNKKSSTNERSAKRTCNIKVACVYKYYWWAQEIQLLIDNCVGWPEALIKSKLVSYHKNPEKFKGGEAKKGLYPLKYRRVGENSRKSNSHYATDKEIEDLRVYFNEKNGEYVSERNILLVDIIETRGWRQGVFSALTTDIFSDENIEIAMRSGDDKYHFTPPLQKFNYEHRYKISLTLALRINRFINNERHELIETRKKGERIAENRIFIAEKTCKPLAQTAVSDIISSAFKEIGVIGRRAGPHAIRRKFGKDTAKEKIEIRKREGMSLEPADIIRDIADDLNHESMTAQNAYTEGKQDIYSDSTETKLRNQLEIERAKVAQFQRELAKAKHLLKGLK